MDATARHSFDHAGRSYVTGDVVSDSPVAIYILRRKGLVALDSDEYWRAEIQHALADKPTPRRRRSYKRRDLTAER